MVQSREHQFRRLVTGNFVNGKKWRVMLNICVSICSRHGLVLALQGHDRSRADIIQLLGGIANVEQVAEYEASRMFEKWVDCRVSGEMGKNKLHMDSIRDHLPSQWSVMAEPVPGRIDTSVLKNRITKLMLFWVEYLPRQMIEQCVWTCAPSADSAAVVHSNQTVSA